MSINNKSKRAKKEKARIKAAKAKASSSAGVGNLFFAGSTRAGADSDFVTVTDFDGFEVSGKPEFVALFKNSFVSPTVS